MKRAAILSLVLGFGCALGCRQSPRSMVSAPLVIDAFQYPWTNTPPPSTHFELQWRGEALHFLFEVEDPDVVVASEWQGESTVDGEDWVELFYARDDALSQYYCVEVDPLGRVYGADVIRSTGANWRKRSAHAGIPHAA